MPPPPAVDASGDCAPSSSSPSAPLVPCRGAELAKSSNGGTEALLAADGARVVAPTREEPPSSRAVGADVLVAAPKPLGASLPSMGRSKAGGATASAAAASSFVLLRCTAAVGAISSSTITSSSETLPAASSVPPRWLVELPNISGEAFCCFC